MNALYNHAVRQKTQLAADLARFREEPARAPISLQGSISATLVSFERTIKQYGEHLARYRAGAAAADADSKLEGRLAALEAECRGFQTAFRDLKRQYNETQQAAARTQLFASASGTASGTGSSENPFQEASLLNKRVTASQQQQQQQHSTDNGLPLYSGLHKEQSIFHRGNTQLDLILEMGQASLSDIIEQNAVLDQVQDKLAKSLRTLNVSESTIHSINNRLFKDKLIFWLALILMFLGMYYVLRLFR